MATELQAKMKDMESKTVDTVSQLEEERKTLLIALEVACKSLVSKEPAIVERQDQLEASLREIRSDKVVILSKNISRDLEMEIERVRCRLEEEKAKSCALRQQLDEFSGKEAAFQETLAKADAIIASLEKGYKERVVELESSERELKTRCGQLEESETRLRGSLRSDRRTSEARKTADLVQEIIDAEARECVLRERLCQLEESDRQGREKVCRLEAIKGDLERELEEQDTMVGKLATLQRELEVVKNQLIKVSVERDSLQLALKESGAIHMDRERQLEAAVGRAQEDAGQLKARLEERRRQMTSDLETGREVKVQRRASITGITFSEELRLLGEGGGDLMATSSSGGDCGPTSLVRRAVNSFERRLRFEVSDRESYKKFTKVDMLGIQLN